LISYWFVLGEPNIYQNVVCFTRMCGFYLEGDWLCRIRGGYKIIMSWHTRAHFWHTLFHLSSYFSCL